MITPAQSLHVAQQIAAALSLVDENDRSGFLFSLAIGPMLHAGWTKERIREELMKGLDIAWNEREKLVYRGPVISEEIS